MKRMKLVSALVIFLISVLMLVMATYAWMTISGTPEIAGIAVNIGGSNTIRIAADISYEKDGNILHYPSYFVDKINFADLENYSYLKNVAGLSPYSTADGINWFSATYSDGKNGTSGSLLSPEMFVRDSTLKFANADALPSDGSVSGCYVSLDFWLVSPTDNCEVRISAGDAVGGSFVSDLPQVEKSGDSCSLSTPENIISATARIGFLVNNEKVDNGSLEDYVRSRAYNSVYHKLYGIYQEKGESYFRNSVFTIYEPNATFHTKKQANVVTEKGAEKSEAKNGEYSVTQPIALDGAEVYLADISDRLAVQLPSTFNQSSDGSDLLIKQIFGAYSLGVKNKNLTEDELFNDFYGNYLQYQLSPYVSSGKFIRNASDLYSAAANGTVSSENVEKLSTAGASDNAVIVTLEKNVPQRIRMYIWLEGQDSDCVNSVAGKNIAINLELAGSNG